MKNRDFISEITKRQSRLHVRAEREDLFRRRVVGVVRMFRTAKQLDKSSEVRLEMFRASAIGYIACVEGYFRLAIADLIDGSAKYRTNITGLRDLRFRTEDVVGIFDGKATLGQYVAHQLPMNNVSDIDANLTAVIGQEFLKFIKAHRIGVPGSPPLAVASPKATMYLDQLFTLRHLFAHELATKLEVRQRKIELAIGHSAAFIMTVENAISCTLLPAKANDKSK